MQDHQQNIIEVYNKSAINYEKTIAQLQNYNETYDYLANLLQDNQIILDLACGPGNISLYLLKSKKLKIIGFDLSIGMLNIAQKQIPNGKFVQNTIVNFEMDEMIDCIVNGFGFPYLNKEQVFSSLQSSYHVLNRNGLIYLSFMEGEKCGFETPSFNTEEKLYIYYHQKESIIKQMEQLGFQILRQWELKYLEQDGTYTQDIVIIGKK